MIFRKTIRTGENEIEYLMEDCEPEQILTILSHMKEINKDLCLTCHFKDYYEVANDFNQAVKP